MRATWILQNLLNDKYVIKIYKFISIYIYIHICMNIDQVYITVNQCCYFVIKCSWSHSINLSCELANQLFCKLEHQLFCKPLRNLVSNWIKILHINFFYNILFFFIQSFTETSKMISVKCNKVLFPCLKKMTNIHVSSTPKLIWKQPYKCSTE